MVWVSCWLAWSLMLLRTWGEPFVHIFLSSMDGAPQAGSGITLRTWTLHCPCVTVVLHRKRRLNRIASTLPANQFCLLSPRQEAGPGLMMQFARAGNEARMGRPNAVLWSADDDALGLCGAPPKLQDGKQQGGGGGLVKGDVWGRKFEKHYWVAQEYQEYSGKSGQQGDQLGDKIDKSFSSTFMMCLLLQVPYQRVQGRLSSFEFITLRQIAIKRDGLPK